MCTRRWHSVAEGATVEVAACTPAPLREQLDSAEGQEVAARIPAPLQEQHDLAEGQEMREVQTPSSRVERSH